jgi:hypothetical protein
MFLLVGLGFAYLNEDFISPATNNWKSLRDNVSYSTCYASHSQLVRHCISLPTTGSTAELQTSLTRKITSFPLLVSFTVRGSLPTTGSSATVSLRSDQTTIYTLGYSFTNLLSTFLNTSTTSFSHTLDQERHLTHSLSLVVQNGGSYMFYADGYPLSIGNFSEDGFPIDSVSISLASGNATIELGNLLVSNKPSDRWPALISSLLRFRDVERAKYIRASVDEAERALFREVLDGELDPADEEGLLYDEVECDPRRFAFPFKMNSTRKAGYFEEAMDEARAMYADADEVRPVQSDEREEEAWGEEEL